MKTQNVDVADCYDLLIRRGGSENHHYLNNLRSPHRQLLIVCFSLFRFCL